MANERIKISQLTPKGANLDATDLLEISEFNGSGYVTKSITGQEIIDAAASSGGVTNITVNAPLSTSGGTTPDLAISEADASTDGFITAIDWNTFNDKQDALTLTTTGTSGAATLVGDTLNIPQYSGGGGGGIHALVKPTSTTAVCQQLVASGFGSTAQTANRLIVAPFIPANSFTSSNLFIRVLTGVPTALAKIVVYSDLNSIPNNLIYASTDLDCSTTGTKTATTSISFVAGNVYWVGVFTSLTQVIFTFTAAQTYSFNVTGSTPGPSNAYSSIVTYGTAPNPAPTLGASLTTIPMVSITGS
jgi:hypothetical protein